MYLTLLIIACIASAIVTIVTFFLYIRTRLAVRERPHGASQEKHSERLARLDRLEGLYQAIHFITLAVFILFGVLILVHLSHAANDSGPIL